MKQVPVKSDTHLCQGCEYDKHVNGSMPSCVAPYNDHKKCLEFKGKDRKIWVK